jgi:hypothetical protein
MVDGAQKRQTSHFLTLDAPDFHKFTKEKKKSL